MIHVYSYYDRFLVTDITNFCKTVQWSGDKSQCARTLECTLAYSIIDKNQPHVEIGEGTLIWAIDDEVGEFFRGIVFDRELNSEQQEVKFTAYDYLKYFLKSKGTYNFQNITPEDIAKKICSDEEINIGHIESTGIRVNQINQSKAYYDIIMQAYTTAMKRTGYQYFCRINKMSFEVIIKGQIVANYILRPDTNMVGISYKSNIDNMVNQVKIYDDKNNYVGIVQNKDWINEFGILQDIYTIEEDKNTTNEANNMLHGADSEIDTGDIIGNINCITGYGIKTEIDYLDIAKEAVWYIDTDTHTWDMGTHKHTMQLTLNCKNMMDTKEDDN